MESLFDRAKRCLEACDPEEKLARTRETAQAWRAGGLSLSATSPAEPIAVAGRPAQPRLVMPRALPRRNMDTRSGRAALIHAIAHIEFNAINLAWDAVYRFRGMPPQFYADWVQIANEEAHHFTLLCERLSGLVYRYGDFPAHDGLWEMALVTAHDPLARMALVPRVLEARGLDVTPGMITRLQQVGDEESVACLKVILRDEIGHVRRGSYWFRWLCVQRNLKVEETFHRLVLHHMRGSLKGPFLRETRLQAGFSEQELQALETLASTSNSA